MMTLEDLYLLELRAPSHEDWALIHKHLGPGDHPSGTPQSVHGSGGGDNAAAMTSEQIATFDALLAKGTAEGQEVSGGDDEDDEDAQPVPEEWGQLGDAQQQGTQDAWESANYSEFYENELTNWAENNKGEEIDQALNEDRAWVRESWDAFATDNEQAQLLDPDSLIAAIDDVGKDDPDIDVEKLRWNDSAAQEELPGVEAGSPNARWDSLMAEWSDDYKAARSTRREEIDNDLEPPSYLEESAKESMSEYWDQMDDDEKFKHAEQHLDSSVFEPESGSSPSSITLREPTTWRPISPISPNGPEGEQDYEATGAAARYLAQQRTATLLHNADPSRSVDSYAGDVDRIASKTWGEWKVDSGTGLGLSLQVAAAEHFGIQMQSFVNPEAVRQARITANLDLPGGFAALKVYARALNETSQYVLYKAKMTEVLVYRGIMMPGAEVDAAPKFAGNEGVAATRVAMNLTPNGAASATTKIGVANSWGGAGKKKVENPRRVVIRSHVPAAAVLSLPAFGQNVQSEEEVVVLGTDWKRSDAWVTAAPTFAHPVAPPAKKAAATGPPLEIHLADHDGPTSQGHGSALRISAEQLAAWKKKKPKPSTTASRLRRAFLNAFRLRHLGPGDHPDGSPQSVHAGEDGGSAETPAMGLPTQAWRNPPAPRGRGTIGAVHGGETYAAESLTGAGRLGEALAAKLGFTNLHPGKSQGRFDIGIGNYVFELKGCSIFAKEYKAKPSAAAVKQKLKEAKRLGKKPGTMIVVLEPGQSTMKGHVYWRAGLGAFRLGSANKDDWTYAGTTSVPMSVQHAKHLGPGDHPNGTPQSVHGEGGGSESEDRVTWTGSNSAGQSTAHIGGVDVAFGVPEGDTKPHLQATLDYEGGTLRIDGASESGTHLHILFVENSTAPGTGENATAPGPLRRLLRTYLRVARDRGFLTASADVVHPELRALLLRRGATTTPLPGAHESPFPTEEPLLYLPTTIRLDFDLDDENVKLLEASDGGTWREEYT